MAAPTAMNQRPWEFYVVENKEVLEKIGTASKYAWPAGKAPAAVVICYRKEGNPAPEMLDIDCAICTENIWLELTHLGLTAWCPLRSFPSAIPRRKRNALTAMSRSGFTGLSEALSFRFKVFF